MSLAFHASPFENDENEHKNENKHGQNTNANVIARKKIANNRTQKRFQPVNTEKVNSMLASIHNSSTNDNDNDELSDFNPPAKPMSMGMQNTIMKESMANNVSSSSPNQDQSTMQMFNDDTNDQHANSIQTNYGDSVSAEEYYKKIMPTYAPTNGQNAHYNRQHTASQRMQQMDNMTTSPTSTYAGNSDNVMEKLNYMINLLEENHDERTGNVTEEVVLYSFLGIFIIFIADSFSRVGKYTR